MNIQIKCPHCASTIKVLKCSRCGGDGLYPKSTQTGREQTYEEHLASSAGICVNCDGTGRIHLKEK